MLSNAAPQSRSGGHIKATGPISFDPSSPCSCASTAQRKGNEEIRRCILKLQVVAHENGRERDCEAADCARSLALLTRTHRKTPGIHTGGACRKSSSPRIVLAFASTKLRHTSSSASALIISESHANDSRSDIGSHLHTTRTPVMPMTGWF